MRRIEFREESGSPRALQTGLLYKPSELLEKAMAPPLQYSGLENPMDGGAWWAAVYGVVQSRTQLK